MHRITRILFGFVAASLAFGLAVAFVAAFPLNRYLIERGRGHALVHGHH